MRGSKSYWQQTFYLLLLGLLSVVGYGTSTGWGSNGTNGVSAVEVQRQLQGFFYFIFFTLAALITLIAPALTAVSITTERQRQSLDLLVTTPLSAAELLTGKMISSVAFLLLLLSLSLPASALCVILGGATLGDVVRVYVLLAIDGLLLAAMGLAVSCSVRASAAALVWSYIVLIIFLIVTAAFSATSGIGPMRGGNLQPIASVAVLNPFMAVYTGSQSFTIGSVTIPLWVGGGVIAFLLARLLLTIGSYRLGLYGNRAIGSLRRQVLLLSTLGSFGVAISIFQLMGRFSGTGGIGVNLQSFLTAFLIVTFIASTLFMPSLFVPAMTNEDDPPGTPIVGVYTVKRLFQGEHSSSLPYFHVWLICVTAGAAAAALITGDSLSRVATTALLTAYYISGLGFLFWGLSRRAASLVTGVTAARAISFIFFAAMAWLPIALLGLMYAGLPGDQETGSPIAWVWIFYPLLKMDSGSWVDGTAVTTLLWSGTFSYVTGLFAYLPWRIVVPGGIRKDREAPIVRRT
jgi:hypothetical protein